MRGREEGRCLLFLKRRMDCTFKSGWSLLSLMVAFAAPLQAAPAWTLERALGHALTNNPDIRITSQRIAAARAGIEQANASLWPRLQFQSSYTRTDNPMLAFGGILNQRAYSTTLDFNDVPDVDNLNVRGLVTLPLYSGGRIRAAREAAKADTDLAVAQADAVRNTLGFEVARAFHTILKTRAFVRTAEAGVQSFEQNLLIASNRVDAGTALATDLLDIQVRLAQAREDLVRARNAYVLSRRALRGLLGIPGGDLTVDESPPLVRIPDGNDFSHRPELAVMSEAQRAADARIQEAKSGYRPHVNAFGSLDYDQGWEMDGDGQSYTAGIMLQWDLWDGQRTRGRVSEARAHLDAAREEERKLRLAIDFEVEQARLHLEEAAERLAVTETTVALAAQSVDLTRARFEEGLALATQLMDAETALIAARVRRVEAEADQRIAIAALRKALGLPQWEDSW